MDELNRDDEIKLVEFLLTRVERDVLVAFMRNRWRSEFKNHDKLMIEYVDICISV